MNVPMRGYWLLTLEERDGSKFMELVDGCWVDILPRLQRTYIGAVIIHSLELNDRVYEEIIKGIEEAGGKPYKRR